MLFGELGTTILGALPRARMRMFPERPQCLAFAGTRASPAIRDARCLLKDAGACAR